MIDWQTAYDNRAAVPGAMAMQDDWQARSAAFAAGLGERHRCLPYGPGERNRLHLMAPEGAAQGLALFVHGGYWMRNGPEIFWVLAAGALADGWAVAMPGYTLCPQARIAQITAEIAAATTLAAAHVAGPIRLAGHSAGGHLAARMACGGALGPAVAARLAAVLSISGIHDLRPLIRTPMNGVLGLDRAEARAESPALAEPLEGAALTAWVGAEELPELRRQSRLLTEIWGAQGIETRLVEDAGHNHFSVIEALTQPGSPLTRAWTG